MKLIILHEKYDRRYLVTTAVNDSEDEAQQIQQMALRVFLDRLDDGWYDVDDLNSTQKRYYDKAKDGDAKAALTFLNSRITWEYEGFEIETPEEI